ncbi:MAG: ribosomal protein S18-alanine N-acetyltransferase [Burkholderiaceae bacterium]|nr:ribosomal protein S18-alanine N-acetyltransferase [Burkholderiaceae bacterium]
MNGPETALVQAAPPPVTGGVLETMDAANLDAVLRMEQSVYSHPWTLGNFVDALACGYEARCLILNDELAGYFVAMKGVDEVHLLNLAVATAYQGKGWARLLHDALARWAREQGAGWIWLEVRVGNLRAQALYESLGYRRLGLRRDYYPAGGGRREDAVVMSLHIAAGESMP